MNLNSIVAQHIYQEELYQLPGRILVILSKDWEEVKEEERIVLSKMLIAVKQSLASVQIITRSSLSLQDILSLAPAKLLVFGSSLREVSTLYDHVQVSGLSIVVAESIDKLDDAKKKTLWLALKKMFGI